MKKEVKISKSVYVINLLVIALIFLGIALKTLSQLNYLDFIICVFIVCIEIHNIISVLRGKYDVAEEKKD